MERRNTARQRLQAKDYRFAKLYARMLLNGKVDFEQLGKVYRPDDQIPAAKAKRVLRSKTIQNMVTEEIIKLYESNGITVDSVVKEEKNILNSAKEANNLRIQLDVVNNWRDSLDIKPAKQQQITTTTVDYVKLLDKKDNRQIEASRTVTNNDDVPQSR
jgi:hypothetical protein